MNSYVRPPRQKPGRARKKPHEGSNYALPVEARSKNRPIDPDHQFSSKESIANIDMPTATTITTSQVRSSRAGTIAWSQTERTATTSQVKSSRASTIARSQTERAPTTSQLKGARTATSQSKSSRTHVRANRRAPHRGSKSEAAISSGKKFPRRMRALLIGISYDDEKHIQAMKLQPKPEMVVQPLRGCKDDTLAISKHLLSSGWSSRDIRVMRDDPESLHMPTRKNLLESFRWLVQDMQPGDVAFLSFSGHGSQEVDALGYEEDGYNETILPIDWEENGIITDDELNNLLIRPLPSGCKLVSLIDACHSGTMLDLPYRWANGRWKEETNPLHTMGDVVSFSGCRDGELSADGRAGGAMTQAFLDVIAQNPRGIRCCDMIAQIRKQIRRQGHVQRPVMSSSQKFAPDRLFTLNDSSIVQNSNASLGRHFKREFKPKQLTKCQKLGLVMFIGSLLAVITGLLVGIFVQDWLGGAVAGCIFLFTIGCGIFWRQDDASALVSLFSLRTVDCIVALFSRGGPKTRSKVKRNT